jgi:hypothetical protein
MYDQALFDRIMARCVETPGPLDTPCIVWTGSKTGNGYGSFKIEGQHIGTHRVSYIATYGPIPDGMFVLHKCDVPLCCNAHHLCLGTNKQNIHDASLKGRYGRGQRKKLTDEEVTYIRTVYATHATSTVKLAELYGVSRRCIRNILNGNRRASLLPPTQEAP